MPDAQALFWAKVDVGGPDDCWPWGGYTTSQGYGKYKTSVLTPGERKTHLVHRISYQLLVGQIPDGMQLDHSCHTEECELGDDCPHRRCVNPAHLKPVTPRENTLRGGATAARNATKTHCRNGHEFSPGNTRVNEKGHRRCLTCERAATNRYAPKRKARKEGLVA